MVRRYNAEGNRRTATPELLRCNAKVIRPGSGQLEPFGVVVGSKPTITYGY